MMAGRVPAGIGNNILYHFRVDNVVDDFLVGRIGRHRGDAKALQRIVIKAARHGLFHTQQTHLAHARLLHPLRRFLDDADERQADPRHDGRRKAVRTIRAQQEKIRAHALQALPFLDEECSMRAIGLRRVRHEIGLVDADSMMRALARGEARHQHFIEQAVVFQGGSPADAADQAYRFMLHVYPGKKEFRTLYVTRIQTTAEKHAALPPSRWRGTLPSILRIYLMSCPLEVCRLYSRSNAARLSACAHKLAI